MSQKKSPFKFLDSYQQSDADVFFGREKETEDLYNALSGVKHLMVYGLSGSGKTSLVECGLRNQFSDADWFALTIRKGADINASVFAAINEALHEKIAIDPATKMPENTQMEFGQAIEQLFVERYQPVYLLFDQFEELLISGGSEEKKKFFTLLNKLIRNKVPCRMMLIMREEFIGHLSEFEPICLSIFQHRFRVEKMGRKNVEEVIYRILEAPRYQSDFKVDDSRKLAESILSKLPDKKKEIELSHVQVFLGELWDRAQARNEKNELPLLSEDLIQKEDNLEAVLESFLKKQITDLEKRYGDSAPLELLATMITERFTKLQLSEADIQKELEEKNVVPKKPTFELLKDLELRRIIRTIKIGDDTQYEISHDVLALVVGQNLTEEMKMREKAAAVYKVYADRQSFFSQDDIDYLRAFEQSLSYPKELLIKISESKETIKKQKEQELTKIKERLHAEKLLRKQADQALEEAKIQTQKSQSLTLVAFASEQLNKDPTFAIRLAELAWQKFPAHPPILPVQRIVARAFFESQERKMIFYKNNLEHTGVVSTVAFSPNGNKIVTASWDQTSKIWEADSGKLITELIGHSANVCSAAFSSDGNKIVTASKDNTAKIWEVHSGQLIAELIGHSESVNSAAFSPDGTKIVTDSYNNPAKIWEADSGKLITDLIGHSDYVYSTAFSPDGNKIVTASWDKTAKIWEADSGKLIADLIGHSAELYSVAFSPDGNKIVTASKDNTAKIWEADSGKLIADLIGHSANVYGAAFSPDGTKIVTASYDKTAKIWEATSRIKIPKIWKTTSVKLIADLIGHSDFVLSASFSPDGNKIVTASDDKTAKIWEVHSGKLIAELIGHSAEVYSAAFSPDGNKIVTASSGKTAKIWEVHSGKLNSVLIGHSAAVYGAAFSPDGTKIVTASDDNTAKIWEADSGKLIADLIGHSNSVNSAAFSHDGNKIVTASYDNTAKILEADSGKLIADLMGHSNSVNSAAFSHDGNKIVTASYDNTAKIWEADSGKLIADLIGHLYSVNSAAFSPDGTKIVTASDDKTAKIWEVESGKLIADLIGHSANVYGAAFSPDGTKIVTACGDHTAKIWLTPEGIMDWLKTANIYKLTQKDVEDLGIDFIEINE